MLRAFFYFRQQKFMTPAVLEKIEVRLDERNSFGVYKMLSAAVLIGGMILMTAGLTLWIVKDIEQAKLHNIDTFLIIAAFVLFTAGSHLLDLIDRKILENRK